MKSHVFLPQLLWGLLPYLAPCLAFLSNQIHCLLTLFIVQVNKQYCQQSIWVALGRAKPAFTATHFSYIDLSGTPSWPCNGKSFVAKHSLCVSSTHFDIDIFYDCVFFYMCVQACGGKRSTSSTLLSFLKNIELIR